MITRARTPSFTVVLALAILAALQSSAVQADVARPEPLPGREDCERYRGTPRDANDSTQLLELRLCPADGGGVEATLQTSSLVSGWSMRASKGRWDGDTLTLRETEFLRNEPQPGWRFCLIDEIEVKRTAEGSLRGSYVSTACNDRPSFVLERVDEPRTAAATPTAVQPKHEPRSEPSKPLDDPVPVEAKRGCGCESQTGPPWRLGLALPLLLGLRRRTLPRGRTEP